MADAGEFARLFEFLQDAVLLIDGEGAVRAANASAVRVFGGHLRQANLGDIVADPPADVFRYLRRSSSSSSPLPGALLLRTSEGEKRLQVRSALFSRPPEPTCWIMQLEPRGPDEFSVLARKIDELNSEIRQRRHAQRALEEALRHRDTLLRELHHRTKNYTQMLLGMLHAAAKDSRSEELADFTKTLQSRLLAMGAAQQLMYRPDRLERLSAPEFLSSLCDAIARSWPERQVLRCTSDEAELPNDITIPLALILHELVSHARRLGLGDEGGEVRVNLRREGADLCLEVSDTGREWSQDASERASAGLPLARGLARQIGGTLQVVAGRHTMIVLRFRSPDGRG
jgi:two-component sensor histidine kinase